MAIKIYSDGSHSSPGIGYSMPLQTKGAVMIYQDDKLIDTAERLGGKGWSDIAEYEAIKLGLERLIALNLHKESIAWYCDSKFVVGQMNGSRIKPEKHHAAIANECRKLSYRFKSISFQWIPREENTECDRLSKLD